MPKMTFVLRDGARKEVDAPLGLSVLEIAHRNHVDIEGACEGSLACSTCHVVVEAVWFEKLAPAGDDEEDMLDLAFGLTHTSRLGCTALDAQAPSPAASTSGNSRGRNLVAIMGTPPGFPYVAHISGQIAAPGKC